MGRGFFLGFFFPNDVLRGVGWGGGDPASCDQKKKLLGGKTLWANPFLPPTPPRKIPLKMKVHIICMRTGKRLLFWFTQAHTCTPHPNPPTRIAWHMPTVNMQPSDIVSVAKEVFKTIEKDRAVSKEMKGMVGPIPCHRRQPYSFRPHILSQKNPKGAESLAPLEIILCPHVLTYLLT